MNIAVFGSRGIPSTYSGYETFLTQLLPELADRGHAVTIYCRRTDEQEGIEEHYRGVRRIDLHSRETTRLSTPTHGLAAMMAILRGPRPDVVLVVNVANAVPCLVLRLAGVRSVLNTDGLEWRRGKWGPVARWIFRSSARIARYSSGGLVCDCNAMREIYQCQFGADSSVIPYASPEISARDFANLPVAAGLQTDGYILVAGRLVPENSMIEAIRAAIRAGSGLPIVVAGDASGRSTMRDELEAIVRSEPSVSWLGHVADRGSFLSLLANARVYIHGHTVGGINPSLIEAMTVGARIVALDTPFNRETLFDGGDYFADPNEPLTDLLRQVVAEPRSATKARRLRGRVIATERFALNDVTDAYERLLSRVAARGIFSTTTVETLWRDDLGPCASRSR